jgi:hypothetical protein
MDLDADVEAGLPAVLFDDGSRHRIPYFDKCAILIACDLLR